MPTYTPLESIVLTSATASVTFSNISQNYQDLVIVANIAQVSSNNSLRYRFNSDTSSNYSNTYLTGNGSSAASSRDTSQTSGTSYVTGSTTLETNYILQIMNYSNTTTYKTILSRSNRASSEVAADVGLWRSTSAINSISLAMGSSFPTNNFTAGSTFDLYAISPAAANTAQASGGTDIYYDSSYVYHVFKGSGTFTPTRNLTADLLVIAGGGGSGRNASGGGGAGGLRGLTSQSLTSNTAYTVTVGGGGAGGISANPPDCDGSSGTNSSFAGSGFSTITASGGGGAQGNYGAGPMNASKTGGSGAGGPGNGGTPSAGAAGNAGSYSPVEGYAGQNGSATYAGGGGGAAEAGGTDGNAQGGDGSSSYSSWGLATSTGENSGGTYYYAGGGGGGGLSGAGIGGLGGGGTGQNTAAGTSGSTNMGGGAGGSGAGDYAGGRGGSGIVIVRYAR